MTGRATARVEEALRRAHATQGTINAFIKIDDDAVERAQAIDDRTASGAEPGRLEGIPTGLKDLIDQEDEVTTAGSAFYRKRAGRSATVVNRLEGAGAVIIGRTGLHEWAFGFSSENPHFGPVRNPWDLLTSVGGSSGGTAAAIAAGITPLGIGTDTGGSVRVPAALCGCYGLKPTHGTVPMDGVFPLVTSIDTVGPLAMSMSLIDDAYRVMADDGAIAPDTARLRIGVPQPWVDDSPSDGIVGIEFEKALAALADLGHPVSTVEIPSLIPPGQIWEAIAEEVTAVHGEFVAAGEPYGEDVAVRIADARLVTPAAASSAREWQSQLRAEVRRVFESVDILATPTVPVMVKLIGEDMINGHHYRKVLSWFTALVNHLLCPALALPLAGAGTPPVSLQLIGPAGADLRLISMGRELEREGLSRFRPAPDRTT